MAHGETWVPQTAFSYNVSWQSKGFRLPHSLGYQLQVQLEPDWLNNWRGRSEADLVLSDLSLNIAPDLKKHWDKCCCVWLCALCGSSALLYCSAQPEEPFHSMNFIEIPILYNQKTKKANTWENSGKKLYHYLALHTAASISAANRFHWVGLGASYHAVSEDVCGMIDSCFVEPHHWGNNMPKSYMHTHIYTYIYICTYAYMLQVVWINSLQCLGYDRKLQKKQNYIKASEMNIRYRILSRRVRFYDPLHLN